MSLDMSVRIDDHDDLGMLEYTRFLAAGIKTITVHFSGGGDSGSMGEITIEPNVDLPSGEIDMIQNIAEQILNHASPGDWWNNDGGQGDVVFTVRDGQTYWKIYCELNQVDHESMPAVNGIVKNDVILRSINTDIETRFAYEYDYNGYWYWYYAGTAENPASEELKNALQELLKIHGYDPDDTDGFDGHIFFRGPYYNIEHVARHNTVDIVEMNGVVMTVGSTGNTN